jgi:AraC-like DNA-binding protein/AcrR family transcriptional regulator
LGIVERKERQRQGLRQEILSAAVDVFANEGYQQLSMRRLAEKIEYSPATIYLHFKDKAELFECVCEETFSRLSEVFARIAAATSDPLDLLRKSCRAYLEFGLQHPDQYTVAFLLDSGQRLAPEEVLVRFPKAMEAFLQLRGGVANCMAKGEFAQADPDLVSQVIWAGLHGLTALLIVKPSFPWCDRESLINLTIETMIRIDPHREVLKPADPNAEPRLERVLEAIGENPNLDVAALANMVNLSQSRLQHLFKKKMGMAIRDVSNERRLSEAARLLSSTDMQIKEITSAVGYGHQSSFVRAFRKRYVQTPESYRKGRAESAKR